MTSLLNDINYAVRQLRKSPVFTTVTLLTLALGIGTAAIIFSVVYNVLIRPPAFVTNADRLVYVWDHNPESPDPHQHDLPHYLSYLEYKQQSNAFEDLAAFITSDRFILRESKMTVATQGLRVTHNLLPMLGMTPILGRNFLPGEDAVDGPNVFIISHALWQSQYGGDPEIIGRSVKVNDGSATVIGVLPPRFRLPSWPWPADVLRPLQLGANVPQGRYDRVITIGRLKPTVSAAQAQSQVEAIAANLAGSEANLKSMTATVNTVQEQIVRRIRPLILLLGGGVAFLLLIACSNVTILLMVRATAREREASIRSALGAGRWRLTRQRITETTTLSLLGGITGLFLAQWGCRLLVWLSPNFVFIPRMGDITLSWQVVAFTLLVSLIIGVLLGLASAWKQHASILVTERSSTGGKRTGRLRNGLVVAQNALVIVLLIGGGLMTKSTGKLLNLDLGFDPARLSFLDINLNDQLFPEPERRIEFFRQLLPEINALPGVESAVFVQFKPLQYRNSPEAGEYNVRVEGRPDPPNNRYPRVEYRPVSEGYFKTMGITLISGRVLTSNDMRKEATAVVINQAMAKRLWPKADPFPLGKRLMVDGQTWQSVVGIVGDVRDVKIDQAPKPTLYAPYPTNTRSPNWMTLTVRSPLPMATLAPMLRAAVHRAAPSLPVAKVRAMDQSLLRATVQRRLLTWTLQFVAVMTVFIAAIGIYGIVAHTVIQRTQEVGIRVALGARRFQILHMFLKHSVLLMGIGLCIGIGGALGLSRFLSGFLYEVTPLDLGTFMLAPAVLIGVALLASYIPARRASRVDVMEALRLE